MDDAVSRVERFLAARDRTRDVREKFSGRPSLLLTVIGADGLIDLTDEDLRALVEIARSVTGFEHG